MRIRVSVRSNDRITIASPYDPIFISKVKTIEGSRWHRGERCWSVPYSDNVLDRILSVFWCDSVKIEVDNSLYLEVLRREFVLRKYSRKTVKMYLHYNQDFLGYVGKDPTEVTNTDIKNYLYHVVGQKNVSASTLNTVISALKFYYGDILKRDFVYDIKRPKKDKKLSVVLSQEEVSKILSSISNIKHKAILMLIYSSGLRVGEIVKLRVVDIDFERKLIHIKDAKGRKNRYTILSDKAAEILREYLREYKPVNWLFHGMNPGKYITLRTV